MKKIAVILCGCGSLDGSEIHEAVLTLLSIDKLNMSYQCFAINSQQSRVMNFIDKKPCGEIRNQFVESARIARSNIKELNLANAEILVEEFDALVFPGGIGLAFNLCDFAQKGVNARVQPEIKTLIESFHAKTKPIGFICISPALAALVLGKSSKTKVIITAGDINDPCVDKFRDLGCIVEACAANDCIIDHKNKIISTPAYMNAKKISEVAEGIDKTLQAIYNFL